MIKYNRIETGKHERYTDACIVRFSLLLITVYEVYFPFQGKEAYRNRQTALMISFLYGQIVLAPFVANVSRFNCLEIMEITSVWKKH